MKLIETVCIRSRLTNTIIVALFAMASMGCSKGPVAVFSTPKGRIDVRLNIATTEEERERGLMFKTHLSEKEGMLFLFDNDQPQSFWMKNTFVSLDIIFLNDEGLVVDFFENLPICAAEPCNVYTSRFPSHSALELKGGFIQKYNLKKGSLVKIIH